MDNPLVIRAELDMHIKIKHLKHPKKEFLRKQLFGIEEAITIVLEIQKRILFL